MLDITISLLYTRVSAAADRPARRTGSAHVNYWYYCDQQLSDDHQKFMTLTSELKLTAPETISRSRDMNGAYQNLNGLRDLTTPLSEMVCNPWASTCYRQPTYQI